MGRECYSRFKDCSQILSKVNFSEKKISECRKSGRLIGRRHHVQLRQGHSLRPKVLRAMPQQRKTELQIGLQQGNYSQDLNTS